ncbi:hypothetical protein [Bernardetia sp.]|uniref:hypothetical protein n=1 Tax=Bernardetia sp. TaxID=1937974 RepID=UPI0025C2D8EA|nr:hypothetical protein [Bernardetia sp.]
MKKYILLFAFLVFNNLAFAQSDSVFVWENYLPQSEVDSIVVLSTDTLEILDNDDFVFNPPKKRLSKKKKSKLISQKWLEFQEYKERRNDLIMSYEFDLNNYQEYVSHYEKQYSIIDSGEIKRFTSLFFETNCEEYEQVMCLPIFREIVIFFKDGNPFFAMKICFGCNKIATTSPRDLECFKSSDAFENVIKEWERRGWLKKRKKKFGRY